MYPQDQETYNIEADACAPLSHSQARLTWVLPRARTLRGLRCCGGCVCLYGFMQLVIAPAGLWARPDHESPCRGATPVLVSTRTH
jgi:hypothetical protein